MSRELIVPNPGNITALSRSPSASDTHPARPKASTPFRIGSHGVRVSSSSVDGHVEHGDVRGEPRPRTPLPPHRSAPSLPVKCRIPRRAQKTLHIQHVSPDAQPPQALGPGSYGGAREHKSTRGAPFGTAKRDTGMVRPGRVPGPGAYGDWALSVTGIGAHRPSIVSKGFGGGPRLAPDASLASPGPGTYYDHGANLWIKRVGSGREGPSSRSRGSPHRTLSATTTTPRPSRSSTTTSPKHNSSSTDRTWSGASEPSQKHATDTSTSSQRSTRDQT